MLFRGFDRLGRLALDLAALSGFIDSARVWPRPSQFVESGRKQAVIPGPKTWGHCVDVVCFLSARQTLVQFKSVADDKLVRSLVVPADDSRINGPAAIVEFQSDRSRFNSPVSYMCGSSSD
ncbi:hypothetical protein ElyMa_003980300 [Elysia marginata]|uniref:Uncharacterized protein n=1 Tax=Elysia marginata TaxID=1093978 RepID=A0AAV4FYS9_9GAST|nr:hypothetical protein ElyMa_003980300 [Elysia marginata]